MTQYIACTPAFLLAGVAALLTGCSAEPSAAEIKSLVDRDVKPAMEMQAQLYSGAMNMLSGGGRKIEKTELKDVRKIGCKASGEQAYLCDVELVMQAGDAIKPAIIQVRFVKGSNGWVLTK